MQKRIFECVEGAQSLYIKTISVIGKPIIHISRDDMELKREAVGLSIFAPEIEVFCLPAWDCLPYDRLSPHSDIIGERISTLIKLATQE